MAHLKTYKLKSDQIEQIKLFSQEKKFQVETQLFYEGQIPIVAYLVVKGCIDLLKNKKIKITLCEGSIVGVNELLNHTPSKLSARVQADSILYFLDKSTLNEIIGTRNTHLSTIFSEGNSK